MSQDGNTARCARIEKLLTKALECHAQAFDCINEAQKLAAGKEGVGAVLKRLMSSFSEEWQRRTGSKTPYTFKAQTDCAHLKRWLKITTEDDIVSRMTAYFHDADSFTERAGYTFPIFVARWNQLGALSMSTRETHSLAWMDECRELHRSECGSAWRHQQRMDLDRMRAERQDAEAV